MIPEDEERRVREPLVGALGPGVDGPETNASGARKAPGCWQVRQQYRSALIARGTCSGSAKICRRNQRITWRRARTANSSRPIPVRRRKRSMFRDARPALLEAAESGRTDEDDAAEALRMLRGGDDDILPGGGERDDID